MNATSRHWVDGLALEHLDAAYNLGRWLLGNEQDAADAVHDAYLRAARARDTYAGGSARAWWLAIVRNCCLTRLESRGRDARNVAIDQRASGTEVELPAANDPSVEDQIGDVQQAARLRGHIARLPVEFRETLILREIEELSYREIAELQQAPIGTVMSRLARGRALLRQAFAAEESSDGL